jgi:hypothetical protein
VRRQFRRFGAAAQLTYLRERGTEDGAEVEGAQWDQPGRWRRSGVRDLVITVVRPFAARRRLLCGSPRAISEAPTTGLIEMRKVARDEPVPPGSSTSPVGSRVIPRRRTSCLCPAGCIVHGLWFHT